MEEYANCIPIQNSHNHSQNLQLRSSFKKTAKPQVPLPPLKEAKDLARRDGLTTYDNADFVDQVSLVSLDSHRFSNPGRQDLFKACFKKMNDNN
jgi:hypothetical protein